MSLQVKDAIQTEWAVVVDGKVHAAIWKPADKGDPANGYLTVYTTVADRRGNETTTCMHQQWCDIGDLGFVWDERHIMAKQHKAKVCKNCEEE